MIEECIITSGPIVQATFFYFMFLKLRDYKFELSIKNVIIMLAYVLVYVLIGKLWVMLDLGIMTNFTQLPYAIIFMAYITKSKLIHSFNITVLIFALTFCANVICMTASIAIARNVEWFNDLHFLMLLYGLETLWQAVVLAAVYKIEFLNKRIIYYTEHNVSKGLNRYILVMGIGCELYYLIIICASFAGIIDDMVLMAMMIPAFFLFAVIVVMAMMDAVGRYKGAVKAEKDAIFKHDQVNMMGAIMAMLKDAETDSREIEKVIQEHLGIWQSDLLPFIPLTGDKAVDGVLRYMVSEARKAGVYLEVNVRDSVDVLIKLGVRKNDLIRIISNLVNNSIREVLIKNNGYMEICITFGINKEDNTYYIAVADTAPPIPEKVMKKLGIVGNTTREAEGGSGLGLAIVMDVVNKNKGRIRFNNKAMCEMSKEILVDFDLEKSKVTM